MTQRLRRDLRAQKKRYLLDRRFRNNKHQTTEPSLTRSKTTQRDYSGVYITYGGYLPLTTVHEQTVSQENTE